MDKDAIMFVLQGGLSVLILLLGIIMNGMRNSVERVATDLKGLNDAVLGKYITREEHDARAREQRQLDHELRTMIQQTMVDIATITGKPFVGPK